MRDRHVRIDVFSERWRDDRRRRVDRIGILVLLIPMMLVIGVSSFSYVAQSWSVLEGSAEISGLPGLFMMKSLIPVFALLMLVGGSVALGSAMTAHLDLVLLLVLLLALMAGYPVGLTLGGYFRAVRRYGLDVGYVRLRLVFCFAVTAVRHHEQFGSVVGSHVCFHGADSGTLAFGGKHAGYGRPIVFPVFAAD